MSSRTWSVWKFKADGDSYHIWGSFSASTTDPTEALEQAHKVSPRYFEDGALFFVKDNITGSGKLLRWEEPVRGRAVPVTR